MTAWGADVEETGNMFERTWSESSEHAVAAVIATLDILSRVALHKPVAAKNAHITREMITARGARS